MERRKIANNAPSSMKGEKGESRARARRKTMDNALFDGS